MINLQSTILYASILLICIHQGAAIKCFECNSHNDPDCAKDIPPDAFIKECLHSSTGVKYTMCRKITQIIEFEVNGLPPDNRVIRGCGYDISNYVAKCYQRSGFGGRQEVCSCLEDMCNDVTRRQISPITFLLPTALLVMVVKLFAV